MKNKTKIAIVNSHPTQYFGPMYRYLNQNPSLEITALYCSDVNIRKSYDDQFNEIISYDNDILSGYNVKFLGTRYSKRKIGGFWSLIVPEIWKEIKNGEYNVIWIHGYSFCAFIIALFAGKFFKKKVFLRGETHLNLKRKFLKQKLHEFLVRFLFKFYDGFLAIGTANKEYYEAMGVSQEKIFLVPYTIDNDFFKVQRDNNDQVKQSTLKKIDKSLPTLLFASKFMKRKNPMLLLEASKILTDKNFHHNMVFIGSGEMLPKMMEYISNHQLNHIFLEGFVNQSQLPKIYAESDIFILPSENEPWGLIVNEVMAAGMPIVISSEIGCSKDLVKEGINGYTFETNNLDELVLHLEDMISNSEKTKLMGEKSKHIISKWSYAECSKGLIRAINEIK